MTAGGSLGLILPLPHALVWEKWQPLKNRIGLSRGCWTSVGQGFLPSRKRIAEVVPRTMRCNRMTFKSRKGKLNVFWQRWSSRELAPEGSLSLEYYKG